MKIIPFWKPVFWLAIICYGLFIPVANLPTKPFLNIPHFDKIVHFSLFFGLCILLLRPFKKLNLKYYIIAPSISFFLGFLLETTQHLITTSRNSDFYDFLANTSGIIVSTLFYYFFVSEKKWETLF